MTTASPGGKSCCVRSVTNYRYRFGAPKRSNHPPVASLAATVLSRSLLKPLEGTEIAESLNSALSKASSALPPQGHEYVRSMEQMFASALSKNGQPAEVLELSKPTTRKPRHPRMPTIVKASGAGAVGEKGETYGWTRKPKRKRRRPSTSQ
jgi:hypothetical protein